MDASDHNEAQTNRMASITAWRPTTPTYDSCSPAKERFAESSPGAEDLTAQAMSAGYGAKASTTADRHLCGDGVRQEGGADSQGSVPDFLPTHVLEPLAIQFHADQALQPRLGKEKLVGPNGHTEARRYRMARVGQGS